MGISFSIPIDIAQKIAEQLKLHGKVYHGQLGVEIQAVTPEIAKSFGLASANGALIANVLPGSAAEKAGLQAGDVVMDVDGKTINNAADLPVIVGGHKPKDSLRLNVMRGGVSRQLLVVLSAASDGSATNLSPENGVPPASDKYLNLAKFGLEAINTDDARLPTSWHKKSDVLVVKSN